MSDTLPDGRYRLTVGEVEEKPAAKGNGITYHANMTVADGPHAGHRVRYFCPMESDNEQAQRLGRRRLALLCKACGKEEIDDTDELLGLTVLATVKTSNGWPDVVKVEPDPDAGISPAKPDAPPTDTASAPAEVTPEAPAPDPDAMLDEALARPHPRSELRLFTLKEMGERPPARWLVKGLLPRQGVAMLFGAPGCGKSFLALDWAQRVARGLTFCGRKVRQGCAVYLPGEGGGGFRQRIKAWDVGHHNEAAAAPVVEPIELLIGKTLPELNTPEGQSQLRAAVERVRPSLLVIDTLAQAIPGSDENSAQDVGPLLRFLAVLADEFELLALIVHHARKETEHETGGIAAMRGSSAIGGAADAVLRVRRNKDELRLVVTKQKDGESDVELVLRMETVQLGEDEDGDPITSCYLRPATPAETTKDDDAELDRFMASFRDSYGTDKSPSGSDLDSIARSWGVSREESRRLRNLAVEGGQLCRARVGNAERFRLSGGAESLAVSPFPSPPRDGESSEIIPSSLAVSPPLASETARGTPTPAEVSRSRRPPRDGETARPRAGFEDDVAGLDL